MELKISHGLFLFGGGQAPQPPHPPVIRQWQWRNEPKKFEGGTIFERERSDRAGGGCGRAGVPPPTLGSFFIFRLEKCAIWGIPKKEIST